MIKKLFQIIICICLLLVPQTSFAETDVVSLPSMTTYQLYNDNMSIDLPNDWYFNTRSSIDDDFLKVSKNSAFKLKKYFGQKHIEYNLVSKDLMQEINVIVIHDSNSKLIFDYNTVDKTKLKNQMETLVSQGAQEEKAGVTTYKSTELRQINNCLFSVLKGEMTEENASSRIIQYSTIINGYGINLSIKSYEDKMDSNSETLISSIADSFQVREIEATNRKKNAFIQFLPPALMLLAFIVFTVYIFINQLKKNKAEKKQ